MKKGTDDRQLKHQLLLTTTLLFLITSALFLSSCAGNKTEIAITGNSNTINTAATTEKKSDTKVDAAGSGYGDMK